MRVFPHPNPSPGGRGTLPPSSSGRRAGDEGLRHVEARPTAFFRINGLLRIIFDLEMKIP